MPSRRGKWLVGAALGALLLGGCPENSGPDGHGPIAEGIAAPMGEPVPYATEEQRATFERGRAVSLRRFDLADGLGPAFNVTFCTACHERPVTGGGGALYRNFFLTGVRLSDGSFTPGTSAGMSGGVIRIYYYGDEYPARPPIPEETNVVSQRNPIPFFGVGLIAELPEESILANADPDDEDHDGISGRPNYDRGFVGRFGRKAQTVSIEGFIRGPLFNHLGVTSNPLTEEQRARLPVDSSADPRRTMSLSRFDEPQRLFAQAAAPSEPNMDDDRAPDPELDGEDLFDLVSFAMLLAPPRFDEPTEQTRRGMDVFDRVGCGDCHVPRLDGPRGPIPVYSDLLLHDMGEDLADGLEQGVATGSEFRTQPLWGLRAVGPYLHDGRATTIERAIELHDGEGRAAHDAFVDLSREDRDALIAFLESLGGREEETPGLMPPDAPIPDAGEYGGPLRELSGAERERFEQGRALFDRDFGIADGVGQPRLNGDSCRACHFDPVIGGSGPRGVSAMRHGILNEDGSFVPPAIGTVHHRGTVLPGSLNRPQSDVNVFEIRQTPHLFGLGLMDAIPDEVILANADPDDTLTPDGITGKASWTDGGRLGRFGWKAQVPSLAEFVRDALTTEMGMTLGYREGMTFGRLHDTDEVADPEVSLTDEDLITSFLAMLAPPPRQEADAPDAAARGEDLFGEVGCASCHVPSLEGPDGPVPLFSDLLLHEILPPDAEGVEDASANVREMRTAPLWGLSETAPYLHSGAADTVDEAIRMHDGEATGVRDAYIALDEADRQALLEFLGTL